MSANRDMQSMKPYSGPGRLAKLDGRSREARMIRDTRAALLDHLGNRPSATQRMLIDRAALLTLQVSLMDMKHASGGLTEHDGRQYLAWVNTLGRLLRHLGLEGAPPRLPTLQEYIAAHDAKGCA